MKTHYHQTSLVPSTFRIPAHQQQIHAIGNVAHDRKLERANTVRPEKNEWMGTMPLEEVSEKEESFLTAMRRCLRRFFEVSTLHGLKYLTEPNRPWYERIFWFVSVVVVYTLAVWTMVEQSKTYLRSPVLMSLDNKPTYVSSIPFPAITICPMNQISSKILEMGEHEYDLAMAICSFPRMGKPNVSFNTIDEEAYDRVVKAINSEERCKELFLALIWHGKVMFSPCEYMQPVITFYGGCFAFNVVAFDFLLKNNTVYRTFSENKKYDRHYWTLDDGYAPDYPEMMPPWRTSGEGFSNGLTLVMRYPKHKPICASDPLAITVLIHNPSEKASTSHQQIIINPDAHTQSQITPKVSYSSEYLMSWDPTVRGCYFQRERGLKFFNLYAQSNCDTECESNRTFAKCGCVGFWHPRSRDMPVCSSKKKQCLDDSLIRKAQVKNPRAIFCRCSSSCNRIDYESHTTTHKRSWLDDFDTIKMMNLKQNESISVHTVSYLTKYTTAYKRELLFAGDHFVANIGGILGLFMGFSILSFVEIIYFLLFRPCFKATPNNKGRSKSCHLP